jgi:CO/xanthine dehydrogenase Mo-binding subunit
LDMPPVVSEVIEDPEPDAPFGAKGVGEHALIVAPAAIAAALRDATGRDLMRIPVRPDDLVGLAQPRPWRDPPPPPDVPFQIPVPLAGGH